MRCLGARRTRPERRVRERRQQHDARDAFGGDLGEPRDERLHRDAAHRMPDEHRAVQVEALEHRLDVATEVLERVPLVAEHRLTVPAVVERDRAEPFLRELLELMEPRAHRQRHAVRQHDRRVELAAALDDVDRAAVVCRRAGGRRRRARRARAARRRRARAASARATSALRAVREPGAHRRRVPAAIPTRFVPRLTRYLRGNTRADAAHDRVRDRVHPFGPLLGGDLLVALASDQHDLVADLDRAGRRRRPSTGPSSPCPRSGGGGRRSTPRRRGATARAARRRRIRSGRSRCASARAVSYRSP